MSIKVLVVDDSALYRKIVTEALRVVPDVTVVGSAFSGQSALQKIETLKPDVLTIDLEMPDMDGIELATKIKKLHPQVGVIMVSAFTERGSSQTIRALEAGAIDFVTKNTSGSPQQQLAELSEKLKQILQVASLRLKAPKPIATPTTQKAVAAPATNFTAPRLKAAPPEMLLIGVSTGGPVALGELLPRLGRSIGVPVFIVQHMPPLFTKHLAESLNKKCGLSVKEAEQGEMSQPNTVYIAPGGKHMKLEKSAGALPTIRLTEDPPENNCRPAVDVLFRSAAHAFPGKSAAAILTGMGNDGTRGLQLLRRHGCTSICQDKATSVVYGMPGEAVKAGVIDYELPLTKIAPALLDLLPSARP